MTSPDTHIAPEAVLDLPAVEYVRSHSLGRIHHVLDTGGTSNVVSIDDIRVSPRRTERVYTLPNGQRVIVTTGSQRKRPDDVDAVLQVRSGEKPRWLSHRLLEAFERDVADRGLKKIAAEIPQRWLDQFRFRTEVRDSQLNIVTRGLRPPQMGGLYAIGSHWSLYHQPATVVMPTGTGKTETMLATLVAYSPGVLLVVVPSEVLRDQTARKFAGLGLLRELGTLGSNAPNPIVGIVRRRPRSVADLDLFAQCNVVVTTMSAIAEGTATPLVPEIASRVKALVVDEAHHLGAVGWSGFREKFADRKVLQFTATPFRRDGKLVDGKVIYTYPLHLAQRDGYFKAILFEAVYEVDPDDADSVIANAAVDKLKADRAAGRDHILLVRCKTIERAKSIQSIYHSLAPEFNPLVVSSESSAEAKAALDELRQRTCRIVVCVNMLGEGFDLPQLKIAAVHDPHKSLAVLLQFVGRFTRTGDSDIGDATVIANIADVEVSSALERLYSEDADWNQLLNEYSSEAAKAHAELVDFLNASQRLDDADDESVEISHQLLRPSFSTLFYEAPSWNPKRFFEGLHSEADVQRVWLNEASSTLFFVTRREPPLQWTRSREIKDRQWDLFVLHHDANRQLLYLSASDKTSSYEELANAVGATQLVSGDVIFRSLGKINRLVFQNIGVRKYGRRNLRFALYTGADVAQALTISERTGSVKSNLSGSGWENGKPTTIGCSYKGRVWSREPGTIPELIGWCEAVGRKLQDDTIDTRQIIANVLIPEEVESLPRNEPLSIEWPVELLRQSEDRVILRRDAAELELSMVDIAIHRVDYDSNQLHFFLRSVDEEEWATFVMEVGGAGGFNVTQTSQLPVRIRAGIIETELSSYLSDYPPLIRFTDLSELDGNLLIKPQHAQQLVLPNEAVEVWEWGGVDTTKESMWKNGVERRDSIQWRAAQDFVKGGFHIVFDDDAPGEAADLVCLKEESDHIRLALVHCKFARGAPGGERVQDVVEVCSQAVRSSKWKWKFRDLCRHIAAREKRLATAARRTRFLSGGSAILNRFAKVSRFKEVKAEILIVQPGVSRSRLTPDQTTVLAAAHSFIKETIDVELSIAASP